MKCMFFPGGGLLPEVSSKTTVSILVVVATHT